MRGRSMAGRNPKTALCFLFSLFLSLSPVVPRESAAQEKKTIRVAFVSLSWHQELPFRAALVRGFFKEQGLAIEPILIRGGPADQDQIGRAHVCTPVTRL